MRAVVCRVSRASVTIEGRETRAIGRGFLVFLGISREDSEADCRKLAKKIASLRVFEDEAGKMNVSLKDACGQLLVISNFTLYANCWSGNRPDFMAAAGPEKAGPLYKLFLDECGAHGFTPVSGEFGADMEIESVNEGPVTLVIET